MRRRSTIALAVPALALAGGLLLAPPAQAESGTWTLKDGSTLTWKDGSDTLCLRTQSGTLNVTMYRTVNGTMQRFPQHGLTDKAGGGATCTGNLAIPEDKVFHTEVTRLPSLVAYLGPDIVS